MALSSFQFTVLFPILASMSAGIVALLYQTHLLEKLLVPLFTQHIDEANIPFAVIALLLFITFNVLTTLAIILNGRIDFDKTGLERSRQFSGLAQRLYNCHGNFKEGLMAFALASYMAALKNVPIHVRISMSLIYLAMRCVYMLGCIVSMSMLRSVTWICGMICIYVLVGYSIVPGFEGYLNAFVAVVMAYPGFAQWMSPASMPTKSTFSAPSN